MVILVAWSEKESWLGGWGYSSGAFGFTKGPKPIWEANGGGTRGARKVLTLGLTNGTNGTNKWVETEEKLVDIEKNQQLSK